MHHHRRNSSYFRPKQQQAIIRTIKTKYNPMQSLQPDRRELNLQPPDARTLPLPSMDWLL